MQTVVSTARSWIYLLAIVGVAVVVAARLIWLVRPEWSDDEGVITLSFYCAAEARRPIEEIIDSFQRRSGIRVQMHYGPSPRLLDQITSDGAGDLLLSVDDLHMHEARRQGLVDQERPVACLIPVVLASANSRRHIHALSDLTAQGIRLGLASPETILGGITSAILQKNDIEVEHIRDNSIVFSQTGGELAQAVELGHIDATVVWRPLARQYAHQSRVIEISPDRTVVSSLVAVVLTTSQHADAARHLVGFLEGNLAQDTFRRYEYACGDALRE